MNQIPFEIVEDGINAADAGVPGSYWYPFNKSTETPISSERCRRSETFQMTPCGSPLPELEVPMISTMVTCLGSEHRKLDDHILQLAFAATRLASDLDALTTNQQAVEVWDEIRRDLWSHLQIEDGLVFSWGEAHHAMSGTLLDTLKIERQEMRKLVAALPGLSSGLDREPQTAGDRGAFARTLLALAQTLDAHVERYDGEVLSSIIRALFHSSVALRRRTCADSSAFAEESASSPPVTSRLCSSYEWPAHCV